ncbi:MAG: flagellar motor switch protein FliN [Pirellulales bacterium]|nr:flagellar motor switch protein FliN [Pirellulales bacterium]
MADASQNVPQDEIEKLLEAARTREGGGAEPAASAPSADEIESLIEQASRHTTRGFDHSGDSVAPRDVELLLNEAEAALQSINAPTPIDPTANLAPFRLEDFAGAPASSELATIDLIRDVELNIKIELGRTQMHLEDVLRLHKGSVVTLDKLAGDPVDVYVNGRLLARGEVLVLNDNFCVRVAELIASDSKKTA